jgi:glycine cleavage system aminomethyltransferase T
VNDEGQRRRAGSARGTDRHQYNPVKRSPAHRHQETLGARFIPEAGWEIAASYESVDEERRAIRTGLAIADITARGKIDLRGEIDPVLASLTPTRSLDAGRLAAADGAEPAVILRLSDDWALTLCEARSTESWFSSVEAVWKPEVAMVTDVTSLYSGFALLGPRRIDLLTRLTGFDLSMLDSATCAATRVAEVSAIVLRRDTLDDAIELYVGSEFGRYAWETLLDAGRGLGARPTGWEALRAEGWW